MNLRSRNPLPLIVALATMLLAPALASAHGLDRPTAAPGATAPLSENSQRGAQLPIPASRQAYATLSPAPHQGYTSAYGELASESLLAPNKGLTTPKRYFEGKTRSQVETALENKYGPPRSVRPEGKTYYDPKSGRSFNVHEEAGHMGGKPHVDIRRRGNYPERKYLLGEE